MDEIRNSSTAAQITSSLSQNGSLTHSLAQEMQAKLLDPEQHDPDDETVFGSEHTEDDDYVETVITRRKVCIYL